MLPTLAAIADLVAAAGVIASLLFMAVQLREHYRLAGLNDWRGLPETPTHYNAATNGSCVADVVGRGNADQGR